MFTDTAGVPYVFVPFLKVQLLQLYKTNKTNRRVMLRYMVFNHWLDIINDCYHACIVILHKYVTPIVTFYKKYTLNATRTP